VSRTERWRASLDSEHRVKFDCRYLTKGYHQISLFVIMLGIFLTCLLCSTSSLKIQLDPDTTSGMEFANAPAGLDAKTKAHCLKQPTPQTECGKNDRFTTAELKAGMAEFKEFWATRPKNNDKKAGFKLGANHQFAEWFLVKTLKPTAIVESGVLGGGATWGLRNAAGPDTPIFSFDPQDLTGQGFHDSNPNTKYFLAGDWKDISVADWDSLIPKEQRSSALVILDDHQIFFDRFKVLKELGFRHVFIEDNNRYGNGNTPPNFFCTKSELGKDAYKMWGITDAFYNSPWGNITEAKQAGVHAARPLQARTLTWEEHEKNAKWVRENMKTYFEFPAIYDVCQSQPSLFKDANELKNIGMSTSIHDGKYYDHRYPPYVEIAQDEKTA